MAPEMEARPWRGDGDEFSRLGSRRPLRPRRPAPRRAAGHQAPVAVASVALEEEEDRFGVIRERGSLPNFQNSLEIRMRSQRKFGRPAPPRFPRTRRGAWVGTTLYSPPSWAKALHPSMNDSLLPPHLSESVK